MEQLIKKLFLMPQLGLKSSRIFIFSTEMLISFELMHKIIHFSHQSNKSQHANWNYHRADLNSNLMTVINVVTEISSVLENKKPGNWAGESCHDDKNKNLLTILIKTWKNWEIITHLHRSPTIWKFSQQRDSMIKCAVAEKFPTHFHRENESCF